MRANLSNINFSDFRIVNMENVMNSKVEDGADLDTFYDALRSFPFRTEYTPLLYAGSEEDEKALLQKCTSIIDGTHTVVNCVDPPVPTNWWVVSLSLLLIACTILLWVWGCKTT